jgi:hypothetical protein
MIKEKMELRRHKLAILLIIAIFSFSLATEIFASLVSNCSNGTNKCSCASGCSCGDDLSVKQSSCDSKEYAKSVSIAPSIIQEFAVKFLHKDYSATAGTITAGIELEKPVSGYGVEYTPIPTNNNTYQILSQYRSPPII